MGRDNLWETLDWVSPNDSTIEPTVAGLSSPDTWWRIFSRVGSARHLNQSAHSSNFSSSTWDTV